MSAGDDDSEALAAEYVLGLLHGDEAAGAERRIASDGTFAVAVDAWRERLVALDMTAAPQPVSERLWARIAGDLALPSGVAGQRRAAHPRLASQLWGNVALWRGLAAGAAAAAATLAALIIVPPSRLDQPAFVAVLTTGAGRPGAVVHAYADGRVTVIPLEMAPIPQGRTLQVWTRPLSATAPVAIGLMDQLRTIRLDLRNLSPAQLRQQFAISLEPAGGSPTGMPTGPVVMQGDLAPAR